MASWLHLTLPSRVLELRTHFVSGETVRCTMTGGPRSSSSLHTVTGRVTGQRSQVRGRLHRQLGRRRRHTDWVMTGRNGPYPGEWIMSPRHRGRRSNQPVLNLPDFDNAMSESIGCRGEEVEVKCYRVFYWLEDYGPHLLRQMQGCNQNICATQWSIFNLAVVLIVSAIPHCDVPDSALQRAGGGWRGRLRHSAEAQPELNGTQDGLLRPTGHQRA